MATNGKEGDLFSMNKLNTMTALQLRKMKINVAQSLEHFKGSTAFLYF